jgi:hypothetical protein
MRRAISIGLVSAGSIFVLACSTPVSTTRAVSQAELAVKEAETSDAARLAPADLELARSKLVVAEEAARRGDHVRARRLAEQALVDAQLAEVRAETAIASASARETELRIDAFQRSLPPIER